LPYLAQCDRCEAGHIGVAPRQFSTASDTGVSRPGAFWVLASLKRSRSRFVTAFDRKPGASPLIEEPAGGSRSPGVGKRTPTEALAAQQAAGATGGAPLPEDVRARMEQRLHADFSKVRVHTDAQATQGGDALNAPAYTVGANIFFRAGFGPRDE